ncbi:MAG TPA: rhombotarget lipoprotein [Thiobacillaceae bacterium]|nr:rhombotarget lipoprotein [Thiobacillaceae bacterium]
MRRLMTAVVVFLALALASCASWFPQQGYKQSGSVVDYLYGDKTAPVAMTPTVTTLRPPVRVGIAFVPSKAWGTGGVPDSEQQHMLDKVKAAFAHHPFIGSIEVIPNTYLRPNGGFANLEQVSRLFNVEVVALLSYDQIQFNDTNALSVLYWTIIGAYVIHGDQYDVHTLLEAAVFDVSSRKLLFRAPGSSNVKGAAAMMNFTEKSRAARQTGFDQALDALIPNLEKELATYRERVKSDAGVRIENRPGYSGGGALGSLAVLPLALWAWGWSRRHAR